MAASRSRSSSLKLRREEHQRSGAVGNHPGVQPHPVEQLTYHNLATEHPDGTGQGRRQRHDHVRRTGDEIPTGGGGRAHGDNDGLAAVTHPADLTPDRLGGNGRAAGGVDVQHDRADMVVVPRGRGGREPLAAALRLLEQRPQIAARQVLHHDEVLAARGDEIDRVDDVRVIERRRQLRLAQEQVDELFLLRELRQQLLEHDLHLEAAGAELLADVDRAHPALGEVLEHDVAVDRRVPRGDHRAAV